MESMAQFLSTIIFLGLIIQGNCECSLNDIDVKQETSGVIVGGKPEWRVTVTNKCECGQEAIKLDCPGFESTEAPDSDYVTVAGSVCMVSDHSGPIRPSSSITFTYASHHSVGFQPLTSRPVCA